jgi:hypothetical protein
MKKWFKAMAAILIGLVLLHFEVEVRTEDSLVPHYCLFCSLHITCYDRPWNLSGDAGRTAYQI